MSLRNYSTPISLLLITLAASIIGFVASQNIDLGWNSSSILIVLSILTGILLFPTPRAGETDWPLLLSTGIPYILVALSSFLGVYIGNGYDLMTSVFTGLYIGIGYMIGMFIQYVWSALRGEVLA